MTQELLLAAEKNGIVQLDICSIRTGYSARHLGTLEYFTTPKKGVIFNPQEKTVGSLVIYIDEMTGELPTEIDKHFYLFSTRTESVSKRDNYAADVRTDDNQKSSEKRMKIEDVETSWRKSLDDYLGGVFN